MKYQHREVQFLSEIVDALKLPVLAHPVFGVLGSQISKMLKLVDINENHCAKVCEVLDKIKKEW